MSSISAKDRVSLCSFTFADGRRCRTPRTRNNSRFCFYHAQKEARARAAQKLGKDLDYFFSGGYLSACDLSTALGRLIPAVVRGDVKPRAARTVAYLAQTLLQAIHISEHEYCEAFDTDDWRKSIRNSVKYNQDYLFPPAPQPAPSAFLEILRNEPPSSSPQPHSAQPPTHDAPQSEIPTISGPAPSPHAPLPPTSAEFVQHVVTGLARSVRPGSTRETGGAQPSKPAPAPQSEIATLSGPAPAQTRSPIPTQATPTPTPSPTSACAPHPIPATNPAPSAPPAASSTPPLVRNLDASAYHYDHNYRLLIDGKPV